MKISEYIKLMKKNRPENIHSNLDNLWEQFYETNEKVLDLLLQSRRITKSQYDKLYIINETIAGDIVLSWIDDLTICGIMNMDTTKYRVFDIVRAYKPKTRETKYILHERDLTCNC